jgi:hypothetical protein
MSTSTTIMQAAIEKAGMRIPPLKERVWLHLKEHPCLTVAALSRLFKTSEDTMRVTVRDMFLRDMLRVTKEPRKVNGGFKGTHERQILMYSVDSSMRTYELQSYGKRAAASKDKRFRVAAPAPVAPAPAPVKADPTKGDLQHASARPSVAAVAAPAKFDMESLTLGELRAIYTELHKLFGK